MTAMKQLVIAALCAAAAAAAGASPYQVPDLHAATELELKLQAQYSMAGNERALEGPALDVAVPVRPGLEASMTFGRGRLGGRGWGNLDTELALKWEALPAGEEDGRLGVTVEPGLLLPTGSTGLGAGERQFALPVVGGARWGKWGLRGMLAWEHGFKSGHDAAQFGALGTWDVTDRLSVGLEYFGESAMTRPHRYDSFADLGFTFALTPKIELQGRIGHTLGRADDTGARQAALFLEFAL
jgi:hypothetical protein